MKHAFIDTYADLNSPIHRLNVKVKVIASLIILLAILFTPIRYIGLFLLYGFFIIIFLFLSRLPLEFILKRFCEILPFIIIIAISSLFIKGGYYIFISTTIKACLSTLLLLIVSASTHFSQLLLALSEFNVPEIFISLLSFMYRYLFLLEDQLLRTKRAYELRSFDKKNILALGNILGTIFIRTYERAERVYLAMCARGYDGKKDN